MSDGDPTINFENLVDTVILVQGLLNVSHKRPLPGIEINLFTEKQYKTFTHPPAICLQQSGLKGGCPSRSQLISYC